MYLEIMLTVGVPALFGYIHSVKKASDKNNSLIIRKLENLDETINKTTPAEVIKYINSLRAVSSLDPLNKETEKMIASLGELSLKVQLGLLIAFSQDMKNKAKSFTCRGGGEGIKK